MNKEERKTLEKKVSKFYKIKTKIAAGLLSSIYVLPSTIFGSEFFYKEAESVYEKYQDQIVDYVGKVGFWVLDTIPEIATAGFIFSGCVVLYGAFKYVYEGNLKSKVEKLEKKVDKK